MNSFLKKSFILILPALFAVLFFEIRLSRIPNVFSKKVESFEKGLSRWEILVLGSSYAIEGINPEFFQRPGFNMANFSQPIYYDYKIVEKYLPRMPRLKTVILPISYYLMEHDFFGKDPEVWRTFYYKKYYRVNPPKENPFDARQYSLFALYGNKTSLRWFFKGFPLDLTDGMNDFGFIGRKEPSSTLSSSKGKERAELHRSLLDTAAARENRDYLERTIKLLQDRGVQVFLITLPAFHTYSDYLDAEVYRRMQDTIRAICGEKGIAYVNYLYDPRFVEQDFVDGDHLNARGAEKMSRLLDQLVNSLAK